jgi:delta-aminolevulinic acid dehydratase/porphobilinogen synthase
MYPSEKKYCKKSAESNSTDSSACSVFITDDVDAAKELPSMPGQKRWGVNKLESFLGPLVEKGLRSVILFGVPEKKPKVSLFPYT